MANLIELVEEYGLPNLRFHIPMREVKGILSGEYLPLQEAYIKQRVWDGRGNKIPFTPVHPKAVHEEHLYISDFEILLRTKPGEYKVSVLTTDGYSVLTFPPF